MGGLQNTMSSSVDELPFALGITAPQHEYEMLALFVEGLDGSVGQFLPSFPLMAAGAVCFYGQRCVEQQYTLLCPPLQVT